MNRAERRRQDKAARKMTGLSGPYRNADGVTNEEALAAIVEVLGAPPERGALYRVTVGQGLERRPSSFIGEYAGLRVDRSPDGREEVGTQWIVRNPVLPVDAENGTEANPWPVWPLDIQHISPAQPGDLDKPMHYRQEGQEQGPVPGRSRVQ